MNEEPRDHPRYMVLLGLIILGAVPFLFIGRGGASWLGLPLWLWSSLVFTAALSGATAWGILRYWKDDGRG